MAALAKDAEQADQCLCHCNINVEKKYYKMKVAIVGLGGVGGYYGGKLAHQYENSTNEIYFIARGEHLSAIQKFGLSIELPTETIVAKPKKATDDPSEIGIVDIIILTVKSYDLVDSLEFIKPCIDSKTILLPLLNGGDITERIQRIVPNNTVWSGCSYIISRKINSGVIKTLGGSAKLVFGSETGVNNQQKELYKLLVDAGIDVDLSENIKESIWKKFFFISVSASLTSYFNVDFSQLVDTDERLKATLEMANEFSKIAAAEGVNLGENPSYFIVKHTQTLPKNTTTSMHSDFKAGNQTEVDTLTGVIVALGKKHNIQVPLYNKVYSSLRAKQN